MKRIIIISCCIMITLFCSQTFGAEGRYTRLSFGVAMPVNSDIVDETSPEPRIVAKFKKGMFTSIALGSDEPEWEPLELDFFKFLRSVDKGGEGVVHHGEHIFSETVYKVKPRFLSQCQFGEEIIGLMFLQFLFDGFYLMSGQRGHQV